MNKTHLLFFAMLVCAFFACTSDNIEEKYTGKDDPDIIIGDELAWFPLNGNLNDSTENGVSLFFNGTPEFVSGMNGTGLKLDGRKNYISIPVGIQDTLSIVFWVKMETQDFRSLNPNPVWIDYGMGAVKASLDGTTDATKLRVKENEYSDPTSQLIPNDNEWDGFCSWDNMVFFYTEIIKDKITCRIKSKYGRFTPKDWLKTIELTSPIVINSDLLYIGRSSGVQDIQGGYLQGVVDEIHIYKRGLSAQEIEHFAQQSFE
ncbi:MAG: hypothetical protein PUB21_06120 [Bacteroidales bacterium]|nr:hypothetical protein [Bacteroidales bacterium]